MVVRWLRERGKRGATNPPWKGMFSLEEGDTVAICEGFDTRQDASKAGRSTTETERMTARAGDESASDSGPG